MRIVHFSASLSRSAGGLYYSVSGLAKAQARLGADVTVIGGADEHFETDRHMWDGINLRPYRNRSAYSFNAKSIAGLRRQNPDVLHIHGIWSAGSIHGALSRAKATIVSPRGMLDAWILARKRTVKTVHASLFERPMLRRAHLHALTEREALSAQTFMPDLASRSFVVPNGIEADHAPVPRTKAGALYLGRLHEKKQVVELIRAWRHLPTNETLSIAGWGAPDYENQVREAASGAVNVKLLGSLYDAAKVEALSHARYFVLPSLSEGLPMAALEALQYGCIPILTDECNLPDLFRSDVATRIASDFSDFAERVHSLMTLDDTTLAQRALSASASAQSYLWPGIAADMLGHYQRILNRG